MALSAAKLRALLLNTGLQQKDNALYQVIYELIGTITSLQAAANAGSSGGGGGGTTTINRTVQQIIDLSSGSGGSDSSSLIPGPAGPRGLQGIPGPFIYITEESNDFTIVIVQP